MRLDIFARFSMAVNVGCARELVSGHVLFFFIETLRGLTQMVSGSGGRLKDPCDKSI